MKVVAEVPILLSCVTAHKITTFRCTHLATMATGGDDNDDNDTDGATMTTTTMMAMAQRVTGYNYDGNRQR